MSEDTQFYKKFSPGVTLDSEGSCKAMAEIIHINELILHKHLHNPASNFDKVPAATLIVMITTNILMNMFLKTITTQDLKLRLSAAEDLINEIGDSFLDCLQKIEISKANMEVKN